VIVTLSELARAGLLKAEPNPDRRVSIELSLKLHLRHPEAPMRSVRLTQFKGLNLFLYPLWKFRVTWEYDPEEITVWNIGLLRAHSATPPRPAAR
jgi:hypothetical protein